MIPTIGVMIGVYILMRCVVVVRNACKPASNMSEFLSILSVVAGVITFIVAGFSILSLLTSGTSPTRGLP